MAPATCVRLFQRTLKLDNRSREGGSASTQRMPEKRGGSVASWPWADAPAGASSRPEAGASIGPGAAQPRRLI